MDTWVHTSVDTLGTSARHLFMAWMFLEPNITNILNAQTPASQNSTTFLKTIPFWDTLYKEEIMIYDILDIELLL